MTFKLFNESTAVLRNPLNKRLLVLATKNFRFADLTTPIVSELITLQSGEWGYGGGLFHCGADSQEGYWFTSTMAPVATKFCRACDCCLAGDLQYDIRRHQRYKESLPLFCLSLLFSLYISPPTK